jgi:uncharacterized OsmC-like protein
MKLNNVDIDKIYSAEKEIYDDLTLTQKELRVKGKWNFNDESGKFTASLKYADGDVNLKTDNPYFLGGDESQPEPMQYFLFSIAASYASSFTNSASIKGISLNALSVIAEAKIDYSYFFSISDDPKIEEINIWVEVKSDASEERLIQIKELALKCCPVLSVIDDSVNVKVHLSIGDQLDISNIDKSINYN